MNWIIKRIRQFMRALTAKITVDDEKYILLHLNDTEQKLFFAMSVVDQYHSLNVAYTIERLIIEDKADIDREFLIRCALLHDIGKAGSGMGIGGKVFTVLITTFAPFVADRLELAGNSAIYIYRNHARLGARKLQELGMFKEAKIISRHHSSERVDDPKELKLLRIADEEN